MAALTEPDVLRMEHQLIAEMELLTLCEPGEIRDAFMQITGINQMADELIGKLKQKEGA